MVVQYSAIRSKSKSYSIIACQPSLADEFRRYLSACGCQVVAGQGVCGLRAGTPHGMDMSPVSVDKNHKSICFLSGFLFVTGAKPFT